MTLRKAKLDSMPTVDIDLAAPPKERWAGAADMIGNQTYVAFELLDEFVNDGLDEWVDGYLPKWIGKVARAMANPILWGLAETFDLAARLLGLEYARELRGFARAMDLPFDRLLGANLIYDLVVAIDNRGPAACSSFSCPSADGTPLLGRNLDWDTPSGIGAYSVLIRYHRGKDCYLSLGMAGYLGVVTAIRPGYWAVNLNQAPRGLKRFNVSGHPVGQYLRQACDRSRSYRSLLCNLQAFQTLQPFFAHIAGSRPGQHAVLEDFGDSYHMRAPEGDLLVQTNHYLTEDFQHLNRDGEGACWLSNTIDRYRTLDRRLARSRPQTAEECIRFLRRPVANDLTCHSLGLHPASGEICLRTIHC